jgi:hypothetical protein
MRPEGRHRTRNGGALVQSTSSCISVACTPDSEGATDVTIGASNEVDPGVAPAFDGNLDTPDRTVVVSTVDLRQIASVQVQRDATRVRIWVNDPAIPDRITIGVG